MDKRAESLRRIIALYRDYLRAGIDLDQVSMYLQRIREAESELAAIERNDNKAP